MDEVGIDMLSANISASTLLTVMNDASIQECLPLTIKCPSYLLSQKHFVISQEFMEQ